MDLWVVKMRAVGPESEIFRAIRSEAPGSGRFGLSHHQAPHEVIDAQGLSQWMLPWIFLGALFATSAGI